MKRCWIGAGILAVLLVLSVVVTVAMDNIHRPTADLLEQAADAAMGDRRQEADGLARQAYGRWLRYRSFSACVADHTPMDEIDQQFVQLSYLARSGETVQFAAACAAVSKLVEAMADAHSLQWWAVL